MWNPLSIDMVGFRPYPYHSLRVFGDLSQSGTQVSERPGGFYAFGRGKERTNIVNIGLRGGGTWWRCTSVSEKDKLSNIGREKRYCCLLFGKAYRVVSIWQAGNWKMANFDGSGLWIFSWFVFSCIFREFWPEFDNRMYGNVIVEPLCLFEKPLWVLSANFLCIIKADFPSCGEKSITNGDKHQQTGLVIKVNSLELGAYTPDASDSIVVKLRNI